MVKVKGVQVPVPQGVTPGFNHPMVKVKAFKSMVDTYASTGFNHPMVKVKAVVRVYKPILDCEFQPPYGES